MANNSGVAFSLLFSLLMLEIFSFIFLALKMLKISIFCLDIHFVGIYLAPDCSSMAIPITNTYARFELNFGPLKKFPKH